MVSFIALWNIECSINKTYVPFALTLHFDKEVDFRQWSWHWEWPWVLSLSLTFDLLYLLLLWRRRSGILGHNPRGDHAIADGPVIGVTVAFDCSVLLLTLTFDLDFKPSCHIYLLLMLLWGRCSCRLCHYPRGDHSVADNPTWGVNVAFDFDLWPGPLPFIKEKFTCCCCGAEELVFLATLHEVTTR